MASNAFGKYFKITTWGESHGKAIGVVIDGCPAGISISEDDISKELSKRVPGKSPFTSPRKETDRAEIFSGVFEGKTTGTPISIIIFNHDVDSSAYTPIKDTLRPGHANYTYLEKYGCFDWRGGGRASARETACRVAAGAIALKFLHHNGIFPIAYLKEVGEHQANIDRDALTEELVDGSALFCPDSQAEILMMERLQSVREEGDSLGGVVELIVKGVPVGLGEPMYEKIEAQLAHAMLTIPASKGFEMGVGFTCSTMQGSVHNDLFQEDYKTKTNHSGGSLGGISNGMPIVLKVAFKPTSSIKKVQASITRNGEKILLELPKNSRHDPCVAIRAVPVVRAMASLVLANCVLSNRLAKI